MVKLTLTDIKMRKYYIPYFNSGQLIYHGDEKKISSFMHLFKSIYKQKNKIHYYDIVVGNSYIVEHNNEFEKATFKGVWLGNGFNIYTFELHSNLENIEITATEKSLESVMNSKVYIDLFSDSGNIGSKRFIFRQIDSSAKSFELYINSNGSIEAVR